MDVDLVDFFVFVGLFWKNEVSGCEDGLEREIGNFYDDLFVLCGCFVLYYFFWEVVLFGQ